MDQSTSVKRRCDEEATRVVEENNATMGLYVIKSIQTIFTSFIIFKVKFCSSSLNNLVQLGLWVI